MQSQQKIGMPLVLAATLTIYGCGGGGGGDGDAVTGSSKDQTMEEHIYRTGKANMPSQSKHYYGSESAYDLTLTQPESGMGVADVNVAGQYIEALDKVDYSAINGHRVTFSDDSFIDFDCNSKATVTFPSSAQKVHGSFRAYYDIAVHSPDSVAVEFDARDRPNGDLYPYIEHMADYSGYTASFDTSEIYGFSLFSLTGNDHLIEVGGTSLGSSYFSDIRVVKIERYADDAAWNILVDTPCGRADYYKKPPPGFSADGPSYRGVNPYGCWLLDRGGHYPAGFEFEPEEAAMCEIWKMEKNW